MTEPIPNDLKVSLTHAGIDPKLVAEWKLVGIAYKVKLKPVTDLVNIAVINRTTLDTTLDTLH